MLPPVTIDHQQHYDLARFGQPAGIVLTDSAPRSPVLRYRLPPRRAGEPQRWLQVVLRATLVVGADHGGSGVGSVGLNVADSPSAVADFHTTRRPGGRRAIRWSWSSLNDSRHGMTARRRVPIAMTNYARVQGSGPGVHTLTFDYAALNGFRAERIEIEPGSGLTLTRQPPQALANTTTVAPVRPVAGRPFTVRITVRNRGVRPSGLVRPVTLVPSGLRLRGKIAPLASIPPGGSARAEVELIASRPGRQRFETLLRSAVGETLSVARFVVGAR